MSVCRLHRKAPITLRVFFHSDRPSSGLLLHRNCPPQSVLCRECDSGKIRADSFFSGVVRRATVRPELTISNSKKFTSTVTRAGKERPLRKSCGATNPDSSVLRRAFDHPPLGVCQSDKHSAYAESPLPLYSPPPCSTMSRRERATRSTERGFGDV